MKKEADFYAKRVSVSMPIKYWHWIEQQVASDRAKWKTPSGYIQWLVDMDLHPEKRINLTPKNPSAVVGAYNETVIRALAGDDAKKSKQKSHGRADGKARAATRVRRP